MQWQTHPLTTERFEDFCDVVNPRRRDNHCWCVTPRLRASDVERLGGGSREQAMRALASDDPAPGVIAYRDDVPVGWCAISPRAAIPRLVHSRVIRPVDDVGVWSILCTVVRSGYRRQGVTRHLVEGAVAYAAREGAPAVEVYPADPEGRMDLTMAYVGTRAMYEPLGFIVIGQTDATASGMPRLVMRRDLTTPHPPQPGSCTEPDERL